MKNDNRPRRYRKDTLLTHVGRNPEANFGVVNPPVYHASTILSKNMAEWEAKRAAPPFTGVRYGLHGTPGTFPLEELLATIEGGYRGMLMSSGLAAVTAPLQALLGTGDHCLMVDSAYGPARNFCEGILKKCGVETTYYDPLVGEGISQLMQPNTNVVYCESPGSLTFEIQDIPAIAAVAHRHGAKVLMDNTWGTPYLFRSFEHGSTCRSTPRPNTSAAIPTRCSVRSSATRKHSSRCARRWRRSGIRPRRTTSSLH